MSSNIANMKETLTELYAQMVIIKDTLFFISLAESVTYIAEFGSLADIFPVSPCKR